MSERPSKRPKFTDDMPAVFFNDDSDDDECDGESVSDHSSVPSDMDNLQVNFQARAIVTDDYHGIRRLLQQLFPKSSLNLSKMADYITNQDKIGSVLKLSLDDSTEQDKEAAGINKSGATDTAAESAPSSSEETPNGDQDKTNIGVPCDDDEEDGEDAEDEVLGVTTLFLLSDSQKKSGRCIAELTQYLLSQLDEHCTDDTTRKTFKDVLNCTTATSGEGSAAGACSSTSTGSGIIIHERFLNIPMDIGPPMLESLLDEIEEQFEEPKYYVFITRSHSEEEAESGESEVGVANKCRKRKKKDKLVIEFEELDCLYMEKLVSFSFPVSSDTVQGGGWGYDDTPFNSYRTVFIIEKDVLHNGISKLLNMFRVSSD